jgi:hypothetical protein
MTHTETKMALAMSQAGKLFDKKGASGSGSGGDSQGKAQGQEPFL